jgi:hypothetical protein
VLFEKRSFPHVDISKKFFFENEKKSAQGDVRCDL